VQNWVIHLRLIRNEFKPTTIGGGGGGIGLLQNTASIENQF